MKIYTKVIGNCAQSEWQQRLEGCRIEYLDLDQWMAQKSRLRLQGSLGGEYAIALQRQQHLADGDLLDWDKERGRAVVVRLKLNDVLVIDLSGLATLPLTERLQRLFELGHAIGNQHWPAVVRGEQLYLPLTVDRRVMLSVMDTHCFEGIRYAFHPGAEVIPYLAPHEVRRLFGGADQTEHTHLSDYGCHH